MALGEIGFRRLENERVNERVKRELWRTTMAPTRSAASARSTARLAARLTASARSARENNSDAERKNEIKERENIGVKYERENPVNKKIIKKFGIAVRTVSYLRQYCSMFQIFETFRTTDEV